MSSDKMVTKFDAMKEIIWDAQYNARRSRTSLKRVRKAADMLGLTADDKLSLESNLHYRDHNGVLRSQFEETKP